MAKQRETNGSKTQINGLRVPAEVVAEIDRRAKLNLRSRAAEASFLLTQGVAYAVRSERQGLSLLQAKSGRS